jgi:argininosuccinate synthase
MPEQHDSFSESRGVRKMKKKVVLAYSGGLDTSVALKWLQDKYDLDVIALSLDLGEEKDYEGIRRKAEKLGVLKAQVIDAKEEFLTDYVFPALRANALYGRYPLATALGRYLISKHIARVAQEEGAEMAAHGATGKGNDQVRFEVSFAALAPALQALAPAREWGMNREQEIEYARVHSIPVPVNVDSPYSIDTNIWGRSIECGVLEDPSQEPPEEVFEWTTSPLNAPDSPTYLEIEFEKGVPLRLDKKPIGPVELVTMLNRIGGENGVGRIDALEDRLVGIKSREVYEAPAATILICAHAALESMTLDRETLHLKHQLEQKYAEIVYNGLWFTPLRRHLDAFFISTQENVTGSVRIKLYKGNCAPVGISSPHSLYQFRLATYDQQDVFDHSAGLGFIKIWGLPAKVAAEVERAKK